MNLFTYSIITCELAILCLAASVRFQPSNISVATLNKRLNFKFIDDFNSPQSECNDVVYSTTTPIDIWRSDCDQLLKDTQYTYGFWVLWNWDADESYKTIAGRGTCNFGVSRNDGVNDYVFIGDSDVRQIIQHANASSTDPVIPTFMGSMNCVSSAAGGADIQWIIRSDPEY
ncbi:hypothetical protein VMCG_06380 [Cytospora schulzeri]|uniref:Ecp2 effector protein-like domain-containing protein n=1 Tax=Cytospora schulzeri TaxID=448051 RepID=A0A423W836_9PEZI|nr:hypothetical protein VMCG_06380 [Valsa malicola]